MKHLILASLFLSAPALACPGKAGGDAATTASSKADWLGSNCGYATASMAQKVLTDGVDYAWSGVLAKAQGELPSEVAAPFVANGARVVANIVLQGADVTQRLDLRGKELTVDGVRYVVVTSVAPKAT